jgi:tetratricopeptide (TPR) repeat protein
VPLKEKGKLSKRAELSAVSALLSSSFFGDLTWKQWSVATVILTLGERTEDPELLYWYRMAHHRSSVLRKIPRVLEFFATTDQRSNAQLGTFILDAVSCHVSNNQLLEALELAWKWQYLIPQKPSKLEQDVENLRDFWVARIYHLQGHFQSALHRYRVLWLRSSLRLESALAALLCSRIADVHLELGDCIAAINQCIGTLDCCKPLLHENLSKFRWIYISYAEAMLEQGRLDEAERMFRELRSTTQKECPELVSMQSMLVLFGLARTIQNRGDLQGALLVWTEMLQITRDFNSWADGFAELVIRTSLCVVYTGLGLHNEAKENFDQARRLRKSVNDQFWCPRLNVWLRSMSSLCRQSPHPTGLSMD